MVRDGARLADRGHRLQEFAAFLKPRRACLTEPARDVAERQHTDRALPIVNDRQTMHLTLTHEPFGVRNRIVRTARDHFTRHRGRHGDVGKGRALKIRGHTQVAIRHDAAHAPVVVDDGDDAAVGTPT